MLGLTPARAKILLLFLRRLKSLVAVELKIGEFQPEHIGKMQFYLALLDDRARMEGENPSHPTSVDPLFEAQP